MPLKGEHHCDGRKSKLFLRILFRTISGQNQEKFYYLPLVRCLKRLYKKINRKTSINLNILINLLESEVVECVTMKQLVRNQISFLFINYMNAVPVVRTDFMIENKLFEIRS